MERGLKTGLNRNSAEILDTEIPALREDILTGLSGIDHRVTIIKIGDEELIYVDEPVVNEFDALRLLMLSIDTGLRLYIDAPIDKTLYNVLAEANALYNDADNIGHNGDPGAS